MHYSKLVSMVYVVVTAVAPLVVNAAPDKVVINNTTGSDSYMKESRGLASTTKKKPTASRSPTPRPSTKFPTPSPTTKSPTPPPTTQIPTESPTTLPPVPAFLLPNGCDEDHTCAENPLTPGERCCTNFTGTFYETGFSLFHRCGHDESYCDNKFCLSGPCLPPQPTKSPMTSEPSVSLVPSALPSYSVSPSLSPSAEKCSDVRVQIKVQTDLFPLQTYWTLTNNCGTVVAHSEKYEQAGKKYATKNFCLPSDKYNFKIYDSNGDGLKCQGWCWGTGGYYEILVEGIMTIKYDGYWNTEHTSTFGEATSCITPGAPTASEPVTTPDYLVPNGCDATHACDDNPLTPGQRCCAMNDAEWGYGDGGKSYKHRCGLTKNYCKPQNCLSGPCWTTSSPTVSSSPSLSTSPTTSLMPTSSPSLSTSPSALPSTSSSPSETPSAAPIKAFCDYRVKIQVETDYKPLETYWTLSNNCGNVVAHSEKYQKSMHQYITRELCLPADKYTFSMYDSTGDGLSYGGGSHKIIVNGITEHEINGWTWSEEHKSAFGEASTCIPPTNAPTPMPSTRMPTPSPKPTSKANKKKKGTLF